MPSTCGPSGQWDLETQSREVPFHSVGNPRTPLQAFPVRSRLKHSRLILNKT